MTRSNSRQFVPPHRVGHHGSQGVGCYQAGADRAGHPWLGALLQRVGQYGGVAGECAGVVVRVQTDSIQTDDNPVEAL